jgi:hypothetical protein
MLWGAGVLAAMLLGAAVLVLLPVGGTSDSSRAAMTTTVARATTSEREAVVVIDRPETTAGSQRSTTSSTSTSTTTTTIDLVAPFLLPTTSAETEEALRLAQELATALADDEWDRARALEPAKRTQSDEGYRTAYGDLESSTAVLVSSTGDDVVQLRLGLVAHQNAGPSGSQTTLFCVTWVVDRKAAAISQTDDAELVRTAAGWIDAEDVISELRSEC